MARLKEIGGIGHQEYVDLMAMMMTHDPVAVAHANRLLYILLVRSREANPSPIFVVPEIWARIEEMKAEWASGTSDM
jgi:hypothetical protein